MIGKKSSKQNGGDGGNLLKIFQIVLLNIQEPPQHLFKTMLLLA